MPVEFSVISIGALSRNRLWGETAPVRSSHATTTVVFDGDRIILVDPPCRRRLWGRCSTSGRASACTT